MGTRFRRVTDASNERLVHTSVHTHEEHGVIADEEAAAYGCVERLCCVNARAFRLLYARRCARLGRASSFRSVSVG
jgi:hypothetical protein